MNIDKEIYFIFKDKYGGKWNPKFLDDVRRLKSGEPTDYIINWTPFLDCKIDLRYRPLIPRTETEFWTERFIHKLKTKNLKLKTLKILDIFSGSGAIGIAILKHIKNSKVDFAELDKNALKQIRLNLKINKIRPNRARVIYSNILENIKTKYDYILANPPYIATNNKKRVAKGVLKYEPQMALWGGKDGLDIVRIFLKDAPRCLGNPSLSSKSSGHTFVPQVWMEFDPGQKEKLHKLLVANRYKLFTFHKDQFKRWRYLIIER